MRTAEDLRHAVKFKIPVFILAANRDSPGITRFHLCTASLSSSSCHMVPCCVQSSKVPCLLSSCCQVHTATSFHVFFFLSFSFSLSVKINRQISTSPIDFLSFQIRPSNQSTYQKMRKNKGSSCRQQRQARSLCAVKPLYQGQLWNHKKKQFVELQTCFISLSLSLSLSLCNSSCAPVGSSGAGRRARSHFSLLSLSLSPIFSNNLNGHFTDTFL